MVATVAQTGFTPGADQFYLGPEYSHVESPPPKPQRVDLTQIFLANPEAPNKEYIVAIHYPPHNEFGERRIQELSFKSKLLPLGVENELIRQVSHGVKNPSLDIQGFTYTIREAEPKDYRVEAKIDDQRQTLSPSSEILKGVDIDQIPINLSAPPFIPPGSKPQPFLESLELPDQQCLEHNGLKLYRQLDPFLYPKEPLEDISYESRLDQYCSEVNSQIKNQSLDKALIKLPDLALAFRIRSVPGTYYVSAIDTKTKKVLKKDRIDSENIRTSPHDNFLQAFIYAQIEARVKLSHKAMSLPDYFPLRPCGVEDTPGPIQELHSVPAKIVA